MDVDGSRTQGWGIRGGSNARPGRNTSRKLTREGRTGLELDGGGQRIRLGGEATSIAAGSRAGREEGCRNGCRTVIVRRKTKI